MAQPWFREFARRHGPIRDGDPPGIFDCVKCMESTGSLVRRSLGCGYEPPADGRVHLTVWQPPGGEHGFQGQPLTVCAGYTCNLPEVAETSVARVHWSKGNLDAMTAPEDLLDAIVILEGQHNQLQHWLITPADQGGGMQK